MDVDWYKKMLRGRCIHRSKQAIEVFENRQYIWIQFNTRFIQSMISKKKPHQPILPYLPNFLLFTQIYPGNICLLGLGGGSAIHALLPHVQHQITAVELYEDMIDIANKYFKLPKHPNIKIIHASAEEFVEKNTQKYRHLLVDLGDQEGFPSQCRNEIFVKHCYHTLDHNGFMMLNLTQFSDLNFFKPLLKAEFNQIPLVIEADGNWILAIGKNISRACIIEKLQQMGYIKSLNWHPGHGELLRLHPRWLRKIKQCIFKFFGTH